jgi:hypothetical protein
LPDYLPWTQSDLESVGRALKRYKTAGLEASSDIGRSEQGIVALSQIDPRVPNAPIVIFEIHKLKRSDSELRSHWVVQIQSIDGKTQALRQHGCVSAGSAVFALAKAEKDVQDGFAARDTFDMAANSYWLKL